MERMRERTPSLGRTRAHGAIVLAAAAVLFVGCAAPAATSAPSAAPATPAATTTATDPAMSAPPATTAPAAALTLQLASDATLGSYVAGENGLALYVFLRDTANSGASACTEGCATSWPPLTVSAAGDVAAGSGITGPLGTITRDDGSLQVTLGGRPLYYFAGDAAAGDVKGQGLNDVWYLAGPDGSGVGAPAGEGDPEY
jgi:predicted lipoprotein with Yx(FWY)xxD motif